MDHSKDIVEKVFSSKGILSQFLKGYEERLSQKEMSQEIASSYEKDAIALIEAGTGTGKSIAYLVPAIYWALKSKQKTIISTHTISLQEQLIDKDIPFLLEALDIDLQAVLVKGMGNYICLRKLENQTEQLAMLPSEEGEVLQQVADWAENTREGSKSSIPFGLRNETWNKIKAEAEACSSTECPFYKKCFFYKARREISDAQVLVVNHHLLLTELASRQKEDYDKDKSIFPKIDRLILDEAHHLEEVALATLAKKVEFSSLASLLFQLHSDHEVSSSFLRELLHLLKNQKVIQVEPNLIQKIEVDIPAEAKNVMNQMREAHQLLENFCYSVLSTAIDENTREKKWRITPEYFEHPQFKQELLLSFDKLLGGIIKISTMLHNLKGCLNKLPLDNSVGEKIKNVLLEISTSISRFDEVEEVLDEYFFSDKLKTMIRSVGVKENSIGFSLYLNLVMLDVSEYLKTHLFESNSSVVLCSATLSTNGNFEYIKSRLGIDKIGSMPVVEKVFESPFDYFNSTLVGVPSDICLPTESGYMQQSAKIIARAIQIARGGVFVLFTSYDTLLQCYDQVSRLLPSNYSLLKQGDLPRGKLLEKFKSTDRSVLFGTDSFWEGVDVAGDDLRMVVIFKLPFKVPTDPLVVAQSELLQKKGRDPFFQYLVPHAIVKFKQGFGRLIRSKSDRGTVICLDKRLVTKNYGKMFINSLPKCQLVVSNADKMLKDVEDFYYKRNVERSGVEPLASTMPLLRSTN